MYEKISLDLGKTDLDKSIADLRAQSELLSQLKATYGVEDHITEGCGYPNREQLEALISNKVKQLETIRGLMALQEGYTPAMQTKEADYGNALELALTAPVKYYKEHMIDKGERHPDFVKEWERLKAKAADALNKVKGWVDKDTDGEGESVTMRGALGVVAQSVPDDHGPFAGNTHLGKDERDKVEKARANMREIRKQLGQYIYKYLDGGEVTRSFLSETSGQTNPRKIEPALETLKHFSNIIDMAMKQKEFRAANWDLFPREFVTWLRNFNQAHNALASIK